MAPLHRILFKGAPEIPGGVVKAHPGAVVKDIDAKTRTVRFYGSAFGNEDSDGDIIEAGAYAKTLSDPEHRGRIRYLWAHNDREPPIGQITELAEDQHGLLVTAKINDPAIDQLAGRVLASYLGGQLEHSVRISHIQRKESDQRRITEATLWEISAVNWGANPLTPLVDVKAAGMSDEEALEQLVKAALFDFSPLLKSERIQSEDDALRAILKRL